MIPIRGQGGMAAGGTLPSVCSGGGGGVKEGSQTQGWGGVVGGEKVTGPG